MQNICNHWISSTKNAMVKLDVVAVDILEDSGAMAVMVEADMVATEVAAIVGTVGVMADLEDEHLDECILKYSFRHCV